MQFDKDTIVNMLRQQGNNDGADQAAQQLPDQVNHQQHADLLQRLGIDPQQLLSRLGGGQSGQLGKDIIDKL